MLAAAAELAKVNINSNVTLTGGTTSQGTTLDSFYSNPIPAKNSGIVYNYGTPVNQTPASNVNSQSIVINIYPGANQSASDIVDEIERRKLQENARARRLSTMKGK
jgi:hypothetical protein